MTPLLESTEFLPDDLSVVANFNCGAEPWSLAMANWIKSPPTAKFSKKYSSRDTIVWLYYRPDGDLVGFGSLGTVRWKIDNKQHIFSIIPALAIQTKYQHLPHYDKHDINPSFSHQILLDLLERARLQSPDDVVLWVHQDNHKAITLYQKHFGFEEFPSPPSEQKRMILSLK